MVAGLRRWPAPAVATVTQVPEGSENSPAVHIFGRRRAATMAVRPWLSDDGAATFARICRMRELYYATVLMTCRRGAAQQAPPRRRPARSPTGLRRASATTGPQSDHRFRHRSELADRGTPISMESDLGLSDEVGPGRVEFIFRMRKRHRLRVDLWEIDRNATYHPTSDSYSATSRCCRPTWSCRTSSGGRAISPTPIRFCSTALRTRHRLRHAPDPGERERAASRARRARRLSTAPGPSAPWRWTAPS